MPPTATWSPPESRCAACVWSRRASPIGRVVALATTTRREQLEAIKRWAWYDWRRIEPKLRTPIVEGTPSFLLFDDSPAPQARVFARRRFIATPSRMPTAVWAPNSRWAS